MIRHILPGVLLLAAAPAPAQQVELGTRSVVETVKKMQAGEYVWAPEFAPKGPMLLIVNLNSQRAVLYRNGIPIGASTVSTGRPGYPTPKGIFTILQKHVEHYSTTYDNAPMPYMQRLTWRGVALHAGRLPGYPASHGCIRLPLGFAKLLYSATRLGMTVVISDEPATPIIASSPGMAQPLQVNRHPASGGMSWHPERSPKGPVSVIFSAADRRALVLRNGVEIGSAAVEVEEPIRGTWAYALRTIDGAGQHWIKLSLSSAVEGNESVGKEEWAKFKVPDAFRQAVAGIVAPGTTVVVTSDSLRTGDGGRSISVLEADQPKN